jgi:hypothetical protein
MATDLDKLDHPPHDAPFASDLREAPHDGA